MDTVKLFGLSSAGDRIEARRAVVPAGYFEFVYVVRNTVRSK